MFPFVRDWTAADRRMLASLIAETMIHMTAELLDADADEAEELVERSRRQLLLISLGVPMWSVGDRPALIDEIADRFGAQVIVLSLDVKRAASTPSGFVVTTHGGRTETTLDALEWAREAVERGAGELLVNSIDADGTKQGFDLELVRLMRQVAAVPVIASGGAGALEHFAPAVQAGADAVLAASVFHSGQLTVGQVKDAMASEGIEVRR